MVRALFSICLLVGVVLCLNAITPATAAAPTIDYEVEFTGHSTWAHVSKKDWITVTGCGFKTYGHAVCMWDLKWTSYASFIVNDNTILCEVPVIDKTEFDTLPHYARFDVVFDGNIRDFTKYVGQFRFGPELDCAVAIETTRGPVSGGTSVTLTGQGFSDFSSVEVYFDGEPGSASISGDDSITVSSPAGEFNQNAMITVYLDGDYTCYLHAQETFHYGPILKFILPPCTNVWGGTTLHIYGEGLHEHFSDTPAIGNNVLLEIYDGSAPDISDQNDRYQVTGHEATQGSHSTISFTAPSFYDECGSNGNCFGIEPTVEVYFRQVKSKFLVLASPAYVYGPMVWSDAVPSPWIKLDSTLDLVNPEITKTGNSRGQESWTSGRTPGAHIGGNDRLCVRGCGFGNFTETEVTVQAEFTGSGVDWCDSTSSSRSFSLGGVSGEDKFCCDTVEAQSCQERNDYGEIYMEFAYTTLSTIERPVSGDRLDVTVGPLVDFNQAHRDAVHDTFSWDIEGYFFAFTGSASSSQIVAWDTYTQECDMLATTSGDSDFTGITFTIQSDVLLNFLVPEATFNQDNTVLFDFDKGDIKSLCNNKPYLHEPAYHWGPTCDSLSPTFGPMGESTSFSIDGVGFCESNYCSQTENITVHMCSGHFPDNSASGSECTVSDHLPTPSVSDDTITARTYNNYEQRDENDEREGGTHLWGSNYKVFVYFPDEDVSNSLTFVDPLGYDINTNRQRSISNARLECGSFRFGPVVTGITPCKGPVGPAVADNYNVSITAVTVEGKGMDDAWDGRARISRSVNPHLVTFGTLFGLPVTSPADEALSTATIWGGVAGSDVTVTTFFDTCNQTAEYTNQKLYWGPRVTSISRYYDEYTTSVKESLNVQNNLYGFKPFGAGEVITLNGYGFEAYCSDAYSSNPCNAASYTSHVRCIVDGVKVAQDDTTIVDSHTITCQVPSRPYGTRARVSLEFGRQGTFETGNEFDSTPFEWASYNHYKDGKATVESGFSASAREIDWTRTLTFEDHIVYAPAIFAITGADGHTRGGETFTIHGEGFLNWYTEGSSSGSSISCWVGQYEGSGVSVTDNAITCTTPVDSAEFNSDVTVHIEMDGYDRPDTFTTTENACWAKTYSHDTTTAADYAPFVDHDWKAWAEDTYHYGPICTGISPTYAHLAGDETISLVGRHFRDCQICSGDCGDSANWYDNRPQELAQWVDRDFPLDNIEKDKGTRDCISRVVQIHAYYEDGTEFGDWHNPTNNNTYASENSDSSIETQTLGDPKSCPIDVYYTIDFIDAITSWGREIQCTDPIHYGPVWTDFDSDWFNTAASNKNLKDQDRSYGWGGDSVTIIGTNFGDEGLVRDGSEVKCCFGGSCDIDATSEGTLSYSQGGATGNTIVCEMPDSSWQTEKRISMEWRDGNGDGGDPGLGSRTCEIEMHNFHYGPILTNQTSSTGVDNNLDSHCAEVNLAAGDELITIYGRAFGCCGFSTSLGNDNSPACWFPQHDQWDDYDNATASGSIVDSRGSTEDHVTCYAPINTQFPGWRIVAYGLEWNKTTARRLNQKDEDSRHRVDDVSGAESDRIFRFYYGPQQMAASPQKIRYSGVEETTSSSDEDDVTADYQRITITGKFLDNNNDYFDDVYCRWEDDSGSVYGNGQFVEPEGTPSDSAVQCPVRGLFTKRCQDPFDQVSLFWNVTGTSDELYREQKYASAPSGSSPIWQQAGGDYVNFDIEYGPYISAVALDSTDGHGPYDDTEVNSHSFRAYETGGLKLQVTVKNHYDWITSASTADYGTQKALVIFGHRRHGVYGSDTLPRPVSSAKRFLEQRSDAWTDQYITGATNDLDSSGDLSVQVPAGRFGTSAYISVLLDPHHDELTSLYNPQEAQDYSSRDTDWWHWTPFANDVSKKILSEGSNGWGSPDGYETFVVRGGGFSQYTNVVCLFGASSNSTDGQFQGQGDIVGDTTVVCRTPPQPVGAAAVFLRFCTLKQNQERPPIAYGTIGTTCDCSYGCDNSFDDVAVTQPEGGTTRISYKYYGISGETYPTEGPRYGNTDVAVPATGMKAFDSIRCGFGSLNENAVSVSFDAPAGNNNNATNSTTTNPCDNVGGETCVVCNTPSLDEKVRSIWLTGSYNNYMDGSYSPYNQAPYYQDFYALNSFDHGEPYITGIENNGGTALSDIDVHTQVVVTGRYFNGGGALSGDNYKCHWYRESGAEVQTGGYAAVEKRSFSFNGIDSYQLVCNTPSFTDLQTVGHYVLEVQWEGASERTNDNFQYEFTQNPLITNYDSGDGKDINEFGEFVTIFGNNFHGGWNILCRFENEKDNGDSVVQTSGVFSEENGQQQIVCWAPERTVSNLDLTEEEDSSNLNVNVQVSLNGGEADRDSENVHYWSNVHPIVYDADRDLRECVEDQRHRAVATVIVEVTGVVTNDTEEEIRDAILDFMDGDLKSSDLRVTIVVNKRASYQIRISISNDDSDTANDQAERIADYLNETPNFLTELGFTIESVEIDYAAAALLRVSLALLLSLALGMLFVL